MVIDTSAFVAILFDEPERRQFIEAIEAGPTRLVSAATLVESGIVVEARAGEVAGRELDLFVLRAGIDVVDVDLEQTELARAAWRRFGKGRHPASLNYGDCFAYALAIRSAEPLLFKGSGFALTDITASVHETR